MVRVAVSILNYNSAQSTIACVQSLLDAHCKESVAYQFAIFVADNASGKEDQRQLQRSLADMPNVTVNVNPENMGFAAGHNRNLRAILGHSNPDFVWLLNSDCLVYRETLSSLIKSANRYPDVGIWGATLLESDGETIQCAGGCFYNSWVSSYRQYGRGRALSQIDQLGNVDYDYIAGASLFFPVATLQNGLRSLSGDESEDTQQWLNERFFLYFEELDLAQRLKPGFGMAWCKTAVIKHMGGASTGTVDNQRTGIAEYHSTFSALKFTQLYYPHRLWFVAPARFISKCLLLIVRREFCFVGIVAKAYRDFWRDDF